MQTLEDRFWDKVKIGKGCWSWTACTNAKGYGRIYSGGKTRLAHRALWELYNGPIPKDMCVCHTCDNPRCMRLSHLFLGTNDDNVADRDAKNRQAKGEANGRAKLTERQVIEIRMLRRVGVVLRTIAKIYGVSYNLIGCIGRREKWKHVA